MEYSNEYYKMKYYKYKAKYEQLKAEGGGKWLKLNAATAVVSNAISNHNAKQAEKKIIKKNLDDTARHKLIADIISESQGSLNMTNFTELKSYKKLKEIINNLKIDNNKRTELLNRAKICSASSIFDTLEKECTTDSPSTLANVSSDNKV
jgi:hypothetical protein